jgi:hypothetical protein
MGPQNLSPNQQQGLLVVCGAITLDKGIDARVLDQLRQLNLISVDDDGTARLTALGASFVDELSKGFASQA